MLDYECTMREPSVLNFTSKMLSWSQKLVKRTKIDTEFTVKHFASDVTYSSVSVNF